MTVKIDRFEIRTGDNYFRQGTHEVGIYDYLTQRYIMSFDTENFELNMKLAGLCLEELNKGENNE